MEFNTTKIFTVFEAVHVTPIIEFFYNSLFPAKSWQDPASIDGEEQNKKVAPTGD